MDSSVRIACCQLSPDVTRPADNVALVREAIARAIANGAQIVVVPELVNSGYVFESVDEATAAATPADGELLQGWAAEAARGDAIVIGGFCELGSDGRVFNSLALVDSSGVLAVYRKIHLWDREVLWFTPGEEPAPVVDTRHGRIGLGICYDIEFPELTRGLALQGAELLAFPTNWPHEDSPARGLPILAELASVTAYLNKVFVAACDRCGSERGAEFEGGSAIAGPDGELLAGPVSGRGVATLAADCTLGAARDKRGSGRSDAFADRRPASYSAALLDQAPLYSEANRSRA